MDTYIGYEYLNHVDPEYSAAELEEIKRKFERHLISEAISYTLISKSDQYFITSNLSADLHSIFTRYEEKLTEALVEYCAEDKCLLFYAIRNKMAERIELELRRVMFDAHDECLQRNGISVGEQEAYHSLMVLVSELESKLKQYQSILRETASLTSDGVDHEIEIFMQNLSEDNIESELEFVSRHLDEYEEEWVDRNDG